MNASSTAVIERDPDVTGLQFFLRTGLLVLDLVILAAVYWKFQPHIWPGGIWLIISAAAITVSLIDHVLKRKALQYHLIFTITALTVTIIFLMSGK